LWWGGWKRGSVGGGVNGARDCDDCRVGERDRDIMKREGVEIERGERDL